MSEDPLQTKNYFLIANPAAGKGRLGKDWEAVIAPLLKSKLGSFDHAFTTRSGEASEIVERALSTEKYSAVVVLGGDGTLNEVVNGFMAIPPETRNRVALGVLPFGSGGDFARTIGMPRRFEDALDALLCAEIQQIDVGVAEFTDARFTKRHFANIANAGVVASVMLKVNRMPRKWPALWRYLVGSVKGFGAFENVLTRISFDGGAPRDILLTNLIVANGRYFGRGMKPAPSANLQDGLFDVIIFKNASLGIFLKNLPRLYRGKISGSSASHETFRCKTVSVEVLNLEKVLPIEMDGENCGQSSVAFRILPGAIRLLHSTGCSANAPSSIAHCTTRGSASV